jgi:hypothetical protein
MESMERTPLATAAGAPSINSKARKRLGCCQSVCFETQRRSYRVIRLIQLAVLQNLISRSYHRLWRRSVLGQVQKSKRGQAGSYDDWQIERNFVPIVW